MNDVFLQMIIFFYKECDFLLFGGKWRLVKCEPARWAENKAILGVKDKKYIVSGLPFLIFGGKCYPAIVG